jgi:hypothetical protein
MIPIKERMWDNETEPEPSECGGDGEALYKNERFRAQTPKQRGLKRKKNRLRTKLAKVSKRINRK